MKKIILTGSTGMIGKGVLYECLDSPEIEKVLVINRNSLGMEHPKLEEVLLSDFTKIKEKKDQLEGYDACFYCMGVSVAGMSEEQYVRIIYHMTVAFVDVLIKLNPEMTFNFVSGTGTDETEQSKTLWKRTKGKAENYVLSAGFRDAYMFRPGAIIPEKGIKSRTGLYNFFYFLMRPFFGMMKKRENVTTTTKIGHAMINTLTKPQEQKYLENKDINAYAAK